MKKQAALTFVMMLLGVSLFAQNFEAPKKGAKLYVENATIEVSVDKATTFDLWLVRSKSARKADFETPRILSPEGIEFEITPDAADRDHYTVSVSANSASEGSYSATLSGKRDGVHAITGSILTINVVKEKAVASKDGE